MKSRASKWLLAGALVLFALLAAVYLSVPLPSPKVALNVGSSWVIDGTNTVVRMTFTNTGPTRAYFNEQMWHAIIETRFGWVTNRAPFASLGVPGIDAGEHENFSVLLPADTVRWQVLASYRFYLRRDAHSDARALIARTGFWEHAPEFASDAASWFLDFLWRKADAEGVVKTEFFTNLPPVQPWPLK